MSPDPRAPIPSRALLFDSLRQILIPLSGALHLDWLQITSTGKTFIHPKEQEQEKKDGNALKVGCHSQTNLHLQIICDVFEDETRH